MSTNARIFNIMQYVNHPKTGEPLLSETKIKEALEHKTIKRWAYILHDEDTYTSKDEEDDPDQVAKEKKPPHWHIVLQCSQVEIQTIAKWFGIPEQFIDVPKGKGRNKFLDCVEYLTHESEKQQALGKHFYSDDKVKSNFDFRELLKNKEKDREKYGSDLTKKEKMRYEVMYNGMTLKQCIEQDKLLFMDDYKELQRLRLYYISQQEPPELRINFYISGSGGSGKGLMSKAIARNLFPEYTSERDIYFEAGSKGACLEGYDGQPVIIWHDRRSYDLLQELGGRGNVFNIFDSHPSGQRQNIKYSSTNLCNTVNIINSVQDPYDFLDGLSGEYTDRSGERHTVEDKNQSYRRFPFVIDLNTKYFDFWSNIGFLKNDSNLYKTFDKKRFKGNLGHLYSLTSDITLLRLTEKNTIKYIITQYNSILQSQQSRDISKQDLALLSEYGSEIDYITNTINNNTENYTVTSAFISALNPFKS